jgi:formylglycine-generating enzyme
MSWYAAVRWCNARSQKDGLVPCYYTDEALTAVLKSQAEPFVKWTANGYRLPTGAEWERAARGGLDRKVYPWGDTINGSQANYVGSGDPFGGFTTPVGYYNGNQTPPGVNMANGYGLYDMAGNVWELCWDWQGPVSYGLADPTGPLTGTNRSARGGAWSDGIPGPGLNCNYIGGNVPQGGVDYFGFRCVRGL